VSPTGLARAIESGLRAAGSPERAEHEQRYLKSELEHFGTSVPATRRVVRTTLDAHPELSHDDVVTLVERLWERPIHECRAAAVEVLDLAAAVLEARDLALLERLIRESKTWALVDGLAASIAGPLVERCPELVHELDLWARDDDFWIRRSALLANLLPLREGRGDFARFARYADAMLDEREFFVRKAIGWVLRDTARKRPDLVYEWLRPRAGRASGVTVREAVKHLSDEQRMEILAARGS
jgi:3-methyladenine DNA glycosylase AlkD